MEERLQLNQAAPSSVSDGLCAADDVELGEDAFYVRLHRALTNKQGRPDLLVAFAQGHQLEDIDFALAQSFAADALREFRCEMNRDTCLASMHSTNAIHQGFTRRVFEQVTLGACLNGAVNIFVAVKSC